MFREINGDRNRKKMELISGWTTSNTLNRIDAMTARSILERGPANEIIAASRLGFLRL